MEDPGAAEKKLGNRKEKRGGILGSNSFKHQKSANI